MTITTTGSTTFSGDFTSGSLTNSGPAIVSGDITLNTTGTINFGSTLNSSDGSQTLTPNTTGDLTITGAGVAQIHSQPLL